MEYAKATWWELGDFNGITLCDITKFRLKARSGDGWGFTHFTVVVEANDLKAYVALDFSTGSKTWWLDTDEADNKEHEFNVVENFGHPKGDASEASVKRIHIFTHSRGDSGAQFHFHIVSDNVKYSEPLEEHAGNDFEVNKVDYWHMGAGSDHYYVALLDISKIQSISFAQESSGKNGEDGWSFDRALVYFETDKGHYVPCLDRTSREVDGDSGDELREAFLDFIPGWNAEVFAPDDYTRGGHWEYISAIDPSVTRTLAMSAEFQDENGVIDQDEEMNGYSDTYSHGGSFQFCEKSGISEGGFSAEESACAEYDWSHDHSDEWEKTTMHSVDHRTTFGVTYEWKEEINCDQEELCYIYQWVSMVSNLRTLKTRELYTMDVEIIKTHGLSPQCMPGQCVQATDCQTCWDSPQPENVAVASTSETTSQYMESYWVYGGLIFMAFVAGILLQKYHVEKKEGDNYELLNMAKLDVTYST